MLQIAQDTGNTMFLPQSLTEGSQAVTAGSQQVCTSPPLICSLFPNFYIVPDGNLHILCQCCAGKVAKCKLGKPVTTNRLRSP